MSYAERRAAPLHHSAADPGEGERLQEDLPPHQPHSALASLPGRGCPTGRHAPSARGAQHDSGSSAAPHSPPSGISPCFVHSSPDAAGEEKLAVSKGPAGAALPTPGPARRPHTSRCSVLCWRCVPWGWLAPALPVTQGAGSYFRCCPICMLPEPKKRDVGHRFPTIAWCQPLLCSLQAEQTPLPQCTGGSRCRTHWWCFLTSG